MVNSHTNHSPVFLSLKSRSKKSDEQVNSALDSTEFSDAVPSESDETSESVDVDACTRRLCFYIGIDYIIGTLTMVGDAALAMKLVRAMHVRCTRTTKTKNLYVIVVTVVVAEATITCACKSIY